MPICIGIALGLDRREPRLHDSEHVVCMSVCACASLSCGSGLPCSSISKYPTIISEYTRPCRKRAGGHAFSYTRARSHTFSKTRAHSRTRMHVHAWRDYSETCSCRRHGSQASTDPAMAPPMKPLRHEERDRKDLEVRKRLQKFSAPRDRKGAKNDAFRHVLGRKVQKISRSKYFYFA